MERFSSRGRWLILKSRKRIWHTICRYLYLDRNRSAERTILLAGAARSGTTWLADIITSQLHCRMISEPFNPGRVAAYSQFPDFLYRRPDADDPDLFAFALQVLRGSIRDAWVDREVSYILNRCRLVKEIRANLLLKWLHLSFPFVPLLLIIRHPCAVVLSRLEAGWDAEADLTAFLTQPQLVNDYLQDKMTLIENARRPEERHAAVWCIQNLVPLHQFEPARGRPHDA